MTIYRNIYASEAFNDNDHVNCNNLIGISLFLPHDDNM